MIISVNNEPSRIEFDSLLNSTVQELNLQVNNSSKIISTLKGNKLEPYVKDLMSQLAIGTPFENSIEYIGGQKFPDIVAKKYYGVEVKTTTQNHWKSTGNSILEGTRVDNVERIFILFAKLADPIEFKSRLYEECLSDVVVTHSPRYLIDLNLDKGLTIFDKIKVPYESLRKMENPIKPIINYYKKLLKPGEELWWIDQENTKPSNIVIKLWTNLRPKEKQIIINRAMVYFPELFSNSGNKFGRLALWLLTREALVCPNIRDLFSAGGKVNIKIGNKTYRHVPRIFKKLSDNINHIFETIINTPATELSEYWNFNTTDNKKLNDWIELISNESKKIKDTKHISLREIIFSHLKIYFSQLNKVKFK